jgi:transcriptional regulator with XRE-family HTH domain
VVISTILVLVGREVQRKLINVGRRIHEIREDLGVPVTTLAYKCGVAPATIYRVESGDRAPSMGLLERIAKELRTEPSELLKEPEAGRPKVSAPPSEATTGPATAGETIVYLSGEPGEGDPPALHTAGELLSYFLAEGKLTVEDLEEASDALLSEASEASEAEQEGEQPVTKHDRTS